MAETKTGFKLMEPAPPESMVPDYGLWPWFLAGGILLVVLTAILIVVRKRKQKTDPHAARNAAFAEALAALEKSQPVDARGAAIQSSLILRKYLALAAADPALYETHEEFVSRHDALSVLSSDARTAAESGFTTLASLKYAPDLPSASPAAVVADSRNLLETLHRGFAA